MTFTNESQRVLTGTLYFPLPEGAAVSGYALDIHGQMIDGVVVSKEIGSFKSAGFSHPSKAQMRLIVNKNVYVDDIKVWRQE